MFWSVIVFGQICLGQDGKTTNNETSCFAPRMPPQKSHIFVKLEFLNIDLENHRAIASLHIAIINLLVFGKKKEGKNKLCSANIHSRGACPNHGGQHCNNSRLVAVR